jgi:hypothetical protein
MHFSQESWSHNEQNYCIHCKCRHILLTLKISTESCTYQHRYRQQFYLGLLDISATHQRLQTNTNNEWSASDLRKWGEIMLQTLNHCCITKAGLGRFLPPPIKSHYSSHYATWVCLQPVYISYNNFHPCLLKSSQSQTLPQTQIQRVGFEMTLCLDWRSKLMGTQ